MQTTILQISYTFSTTAFLLLSALIICTRRDAPYKKALLASTVASAVWSAAVVLDARSVLPISGMILSLAELARMRSTVLR